MSQPLTITAYSTALFSTWYLINEFGVLFDCGDGACAALLQKSRKPRHVFISHADRDHLTGLLQLLQLNARPDLCVYYPKDCGTFPALADFCSRFDQHTSCVQWIGLDPETEIAIRDDLIVRPIENAHVPKRGKTKSLSYAVDQITRKLKPEFADLSGQQIAQIREQRGADAITEQRRQTQLVYSGDTPVETDGRYDDAKVLIHEATFLTSAEIDANDGRRNKHSALDQVMEMVAAANVQTLVLGHFSSRYSREEIDQAIDLQATRHGVSIPIHRVYPGEILSGTVVG